MRQDVYRVAYDEAHAELLDIAKRYDELRRRKETLESVVGALSPMLGAVPSAQGEQGSSETSTPGAQANVEPASYTFNQVPNALQDESITDPFQRRVRNALKFSSNNNGQEHKGLQPAV